MILELIQAEVTTALEMARKFYPDANIPTPKIEVSNRMTRSAGRCGFRHATGLYTLKFSAQIMRDNDLDTFLTRTTYHEVAHLVQHAVYGKMDHKETFKYVMRNVLLRTAVQSTRCHNFTTQKRKRGTKHTYRCTGCGTTMEVGTIVHNKMEAGQRRFHSSCGQRNGQLTYVGEAMTA